MKKYLTLATCMLSVVVLSGCAATQSPATPSSDNSSASSEQSSTSTDGASGYSLAEVAQHSTPDDCWLAIDGEVYDVTNFVEEHPGGEEILKGCGKDASELFHGEREHQGSTEVQAYMSDLKIGKLE